jgi:2-polyprenyl-3-methyl-5-hydroxy-6-metoxy-1,4-benzoquinol methylase
MNESLVGNVKRLNFISECIDATSIYSVLDVGCGTGVNLTRPLAEKFPVIKFYGVDSDESSIDYACTHSTVNLSFYKDMSQIGNLKFDLIIASEVIEHIDNPFTFLNEISGMLTENGRVILTLPNGYGPSEIMSTIENLMRISGVFKILRKILKGQLHELYSPHHKDTLAVSPHINFFSYKSILFIITKSGFKIKKMESRAIVCGFGFEHLLKHPFLIKINTNLAKYMPPQITSAWMFVLDKNLNFSNNNSYIYRRGLFETFRSNINMRRWGLSKRF